MTDREISLYARNAHQDADRTVSAYEQAQADMRADGHRITQSRKDKIWSALEALAAA